MSPRCVCGARHDDAAFRALPLLRVLDEVALGAIVLRWPEGTFVDVRACDACGRAIARLSRSRPETGPISAASSRPGSREPAPSNR